MAFPTVSNFVNVLNQASLAMIIAGGLTIAVVVGELDLSIGFAASMEGVLVTGLIVHNGLPIWLAILIVIGVGAVIGLVNGIIVTKATVADYKNNPPKVDFNDLWGKSTGQIQYRS